MSGQASSIGHCDKCQHQEKIFMAHFGRRHKGCPHRGNDDFRGLGKFPGPRKNAGVWVSGPAEKKTEDTV